MPSSRREFLGAAASAPALSLPFGREEPTHRWTHLASSVLFPPLYGDGTLVATRTVGPWTGDQPVTVGLDPDTGAQRWSQTGHVDWRTGRVEDRVVLGGSGDVVGVDPGTGETLWRTSVATGLVTDVLEDVQTGPHNEVAYATISLGVAALDAGTGDPLWKVDGDHVRFENATATTALVSENSVLRGFDARTGDERWKQPLAGRPNGFHRGLALDVAGRSAVAFHADTGERLWRHRVEDGRIQYVGATGEYVYLRESPTSYADEDADSIVAVTRDGREAWRFDLQAGTGSTVVDGAVVVLGLQGETAGAASEFAVLDPATGDLRWRADVPYGYGLLSASRGEVRVPVGEGVVARSLHDGRVRWRYETDGTPAYAVEQNGRVYVGARLDAESGDTGTRINDGGPPETFALHAVDPPRGAWVTLERFLGRYGFALGTLAGFGLVGVGAAGVGRWMRKYRVHGHAETVEQTDAWTTARTRNGTVRTEFRPATGAEDAFAEACEAWQARSEEDGVLALRSWGTDPRPWVETPLYQRTLADVDDRERGLRAVSAAADVLARGDRPHGALRPASVVFDADGDALVRDLGFGSFTRAAWPDRTDAFAPPEGEEPTAAGDVYRLGALAYAVLAGHPPDGGRFENEFDASVSDDLRAVLSTALARDPSERYESVQRFSEYFAWAAFAQERNW